MGTLQTLTRSGFNPYLVYGYTTNIDKIRVLPPIKSMGTLRVYVDIDKIRV